MVDFAKNTNYLNETSKREWAKIFVDDIKLITRNSMKKGGEKELFEALVVKKNNHNIIIKRLDNNRVESIIFSDLLQGEVEIVRKVDKKAI